MNQPKHKGKALLPLSVSKAACAGDSGAVECVLRYYDDYMNKLCTEPSTTKPVIPMCA